ncbi:transmembrane protein 160 [Dunckerocampus dactyliophorus]|uniref:transmembrane protein 160 n=1 Tax=Dunckerocampus dactyliophorus TaxID=161453 RepID=UPI002405E691|nr:transmembrane protein 160 [Dunckerocampus dactyliophorus]
MAFLRLFMRRQLPMAAFQLSRVGKLLLRPPSGGLHGTARWRIGDKGPWGKSQSRGPEQPQQYQHQQLTDLDRADALILRKSHETGFLSWFRNGLLATGIGVLAFVQSEMGREAAYVFFTLGGACVSLGAATYIGSLVTLRRLMLLSVPAVLFHGAMVGSVALFWLCAVSLYIGSLEVKIVFEDEDEEECQECRERRGHRVHRGTEDEDGKGGHK